MADWPARDLREAVWIMAEAVDALAAGFHAYSRGLPVGLFRSRPWATLSEAERDTFRRRALEALGSVNPDAFFALVERLQPRAELDPGPLPDNVRRLPRRRR